MSITYVIVVVCVATLTTGLSDISSHTIVNELRTEMKNAFMEMKNYYDNEVSSLIRARFEEWKNVTKDISMRLSAIENKTFSHHASEEITENNRNVFNESMPELQRLDERDDSKAAEFDGNRNFTRKGNLLRTTYTGVRGMQAAFDAYLSHHLGNLELHQVIVFDHVNINIANLYNPTTGIFTCDRAGVYVFNIRLLVMKTKVLYTELVINGSGLQGMFAHGADTYGHSATSAVQHLQHGDRVWVRTNAFQVAALTGNVLDAYLCSFSGFLLYPN